MSPQVADPEIIASTGTGWVRLNFVLGPWSGPDDDSLFYGRTWAGAYRQIIAGFRERSLRILGLIGVEAVSRGPGERYRDAVSQLANMDAWMEQYVDNFVAIVELFQDEIGIFESFNEPDDWHGKKVNWVHPSWFAVILQRIFEAVRSRPSLQHIALVSGPLQGLQDNRNAAATYLYQTYRAGKKLFGWGQDGVPFPFDAVGYHIYVRGPYTSYSATQERAIRSLCRRYLGTMHRVILREEGKEKPLVVSEVGWTSNVSRQVIRRREKFQARSLKVGLKTVIEDPLVALGFCFCTQDFRTSAGDMFYGLYRQGRLTPLARKPAYHTFKRLCEGTLDESPADQPYTNQEIILAFLHAGMELGLPNRWTLMSRAGLSLSQLAANRNDIYGGPPIEDLPRLTDEEKAVILDKLDPEPAELELQVAEGEASTAADFTLSRSPTLVSPLGEPAIPEVDAEISLAVQSQLLHEVEEIRERLEYLASEEDRTGRILLNAIALAFITAATVSVVLVLLMRLLWP
jgi:hypothetical protein